MALLLHPLFCRNFIFATKVFDSMPQFSIVTVGAITVSINDYVLLCCTNLRLQFFIRVCDFVNAFVNCKL